MLNYHFQTIEKGVTTQIARGSLNCQNAFRTASDRAACCCTCPAQTCVNQKGQ